MEGFLLKFFLRPVKVRGELAGAVICVSKCFESAQIFTVAAASKNECHSDVVTGSSSNETEVTGLTL